MKRMFLSHVTWLWEVKEDDAFGSMQNTFFSFKDGLKNLIYLPVLGG